ncbi:microtubule organization protein AKNA isoform X2 [Ornithorhynchus anatinus]|uniref:microtubule organization protein AKNA isoform X2 n=1 Tax=Ornithorhynchus anatinus TaxID=9258 RepID=UPI0010A7621A|nr:microtubule organization protein AKNA isoform X2 [Ornithorhynchus anatinus]
MASSVPWAHWAEPDHRKGVRRQRACGAGEEVFELSLDEDRVIGALDEIIAHRRMLLSPSPSDPVLLGGSSPAENPESSQEPWAAAEKSSVFSSLRGSEPRGFTAAESIPASSVDGKEDELEEVETQEGSISPASCDLQRDQELGVTEEDEWNPESEDGLEFPVLTHEGSFPPECNQRLDGLPPASPFPLICGDGEEFSDQSDFSSSPKEPSSQHSHRLSRAYALGCLSHLAESPDLAAGGQLATVSGQLLRGSPWSPSVGSPEPSQHPSSVSPPPLEDLQDTSRSHKSRPSSTEDLPESWAGSVTQATATRMFQVPKAQLTPACGQPGVEDSWGPGGDRPTSRVREAKKAPSPRRPVLASRPSRSLSPPGTTNSRRAAQSGTVNQNSPRPSRSYGQGRLHYPLPDFSKVEPRVRFPKDYHPPRGRPLATRASRAMSPLVFKSPAEIVREVLLSSEEAPSSSSRVVTQVPEEFRTPEQATQLVQQLQEDYHRLLTKYAEAENTIDRLRLGAKVNLHSDPPRHSHGIHTRTLPAGTQPLTLSIPQARRATLQSDPDLAPWATQDPGSQSAQEDEHDTSFSRVQYPGLLGHDPSPGPDGPSPGDLLTQTLAARVENLLAQVESFEGLVQTGRQASHDQLKDFWQLKATQSALEGAYLQAREKHQQLQQLQDPEKPPGAFDLDRTVEGEIFRLGIHLEELKDGLDQVTLGRQPPGTPLENPPPCSFSASPSEELPRVPAPSPLTPKPASCIPYSQPLGVPGSPSLPLRDTAASSVGNEPEGERGGFPGLLQHEALQLERTFLLGQYRDTKSLPGALKVEPNQGEGDLQEAVESPTLRKAQLGTHRRRPLASEEEQRAPLERKAPTPSEEKQPSGQGPMCRLPMHQSEPLPRRGTAPPNPLPDIPNFPILRRKQPPSHQSSVASLVDRGSSEQLPRRHSSPAKATRQEDHRIVSPETDSGFLGSETSQVSPLTQTPEHQLQQASKQQKTCQISLASKPRRHPLENHPPATWVPSSPSPAQGFSPWKESEGIPQERGLGAMQSTREQFWRRRQGCNHSSQLGPDSEAPACSEEKAGQSDVRTEASRMIKACDQPSIQGQDQPAAFLATFRQPTVELPASHLDARIARDQAIQALQNEVSRLRRKLEKMLLSSRENPEETPRVQPIHRHGHVGKAPPSSGGSTPTRKPVKQHHQERGDSSPGIPPIRLRPRSSSFPRGASMLDCSPESEQPTTERRRAAEWSCRGEEWVGVRAAHGAQKQEGMITFRGLYTGKEYHMPRPKPARAAADTTSCSCCQKLPGRDPAQGVGTSPPRDPSRKMQCPLHWDSGNAAAEKHSDPATTGSHQFTRRGGSPDSQPHSEAKRTHSEAKRPPSSPPPPRVWYLASPAAPAPAVAYLPVLSTLPPSPSIVYYPTCVSTSASSPTGPVFYCSSSFSSTEQTPPTAPRPVPGLRRSLALELDDLNELNWSLSQAVQAAKSIKFTTKQMSRSLTSDLNRAKALRNSCLF